MVLEIFLLVICDVFCFDIISEAETGRRQPKRRRHLGRQKTQLRPEDDSLGQYSLRLSRRLTPI